MIAWQFYHQSKVVKILIRTAVWPVELLYTHSLHPHNIFTRSGEYESAYTSHFNVVELCSFRMDFNSVQNDMFLESLCFSQYTLTDTLDYCVMTLFILLFVSGSVSGNGCLIKLGLINSTTTRAEPTKKALLILQLTVFLVYAVNSTWIVNDKKQSIAKFSCWFHSTTKITRL